MMLAGADGTTYPQQYATKKNIPDEKDIGVAAALDAIPECKTGQTGMKYFEFPISDPLWTGGGRGSQGPDRVIAISPSPGQGGVREYTYCLALTHRGMAASAFQPCTGS